MQKSHINKATSRVIGVDIGGTKMSSGLVDSSGVSNIHKVDTNAHGSEGEVMNSVFTLLDHYPQGSYDAIGIGIPSIVDVEQGIVFDVSNIPSWKEVHLKDILENRYDVPVRLNNDANVFAIGEKYFGCAQPYTNVAAVTLGTGLGTGLIINGRLYSGRNCGAGEFGMVPYKDGILENYCSGQFFKRNYDTPGDEMYRRAEQGDPEALEAFAGLGTNLGDAVKIIIYAVDPDAIVFGGSVSVAYRFFEQAMIEQIKTIWFSNALERVKLLVSGTRHVALLGAAALCYE